VVNVLVPLRGDTVSAYYIFTDSQMSSVIMLDFHTTDSQAIRDLFNFLQDLVWVRSHEGSMFRMTALRKYSLLIEVFRFFFQSLYNSYHG
jgi:hypothetical protein